MGRSILGPHAVFAAPIRSCFQKRGIFYLSLDASISQFPRPSRYGFHASFPPFSEDGKHEVAILDSNGRVVSQSSHTAGGKRVVLAGNSHYSRDILGTANVDSRSSLQYIEGGLVIFGDAGAYCESMVENWLSDGRVGVLFL
jgi:diaminopimelate decarboxylase